MNKRHELAAIVNERKPSIVCVTESWLKSVVADHELKLDGYELRIRRDRQDTTDGIGGGILVWARKGLVATPITCDKRRRLLNSKIVVPPNSNLKSLLSSKTIVVLCSNKKPLSYQALMKFDIVDYALKQKISKVE